jgi:hypothetical protein
VILPVPVGAEELCASLVPAFEPGAVMREILAASFEVLVPGAQSAELLETMPANQAMVGA